jgi:predicted transcriptional regulator
LPLRQYVRMQLGQYLDEHGIDVAAFAAAIRVDLSTVYRYLSGDRLPRADVLRRIKRATGGKVTPNDFLCCEDA